MYQVDIYLLNVDLLGKYQPFWPSLSIFDNFGKRFLQVSHVNSILDPEEQVLPCKTSYIASNMMPNALV